MNPLTALTRRTSSTTDGGDSTDGAWGRIRTRIEERLTPTVPTPWSWTDSGGLYWGSDEAWLYRTLPGWVFEENSAGLDQLLTELSMRCGNRPIHLLAYSWEEPATAPDQLTGEHAAYVNASLRAVQPSTMFLIGVRLHPDPVVERQRSRFKAVVTESLDILMAEWVPNLGTYDTDRALVGGVLDAAGCQPVSGTRADMLEFWFTLGIPKDQLMVERDSAIIAGRDTIECVSVRSFSELPDHANQANPLDAGPGSTMVASVRGKLTHHKDRGSARVTECSLVLGRRSGTAARTLPNALSQQLPGVEIKPLPMRQVVAVDETLPCSVESVDPHLFGVDAAKLRRVGFNDATNGGDRAGLLFGMVSPGFAHPRYVDVFANPGHTTLVSGTAGSGKTFLGEHLAIQTHLLAVPTVLVRDGSDTGAPLLDPPAVPGLTPRPVRLLDSPHPGLLDPFVHLPAPLARQALHRLLSAGYPAMTSEDLFTLEGELARIAPAASTSLAAVAALVRDPRVAAHLGRFTRTPLGRLVTGGPAAPSPAAVGTTVWDLTGVLSDVEPGPARDVLVDIAVAVATTEATGGLLVCDGVGDWRTGTAAASVRVEGQRAGTLGALVATTANPVRLVDGSLPAPDTMVLLAHDSDTGAATVFEKLGAQYTDELAEWLAAAAPSLQDDLIGSTALGLVWNAADGLRGISIGPVPVAWVPALTRGRATEYLADRVYAS